MAAAGEAGEAAKEVRQLLRGSIDAGVLPRGVSLLADDAAAQRGEHPQPAPVGSAGDDRNHATALPVEELAEGGGEGGAVGQGVPVDRLGAVGRLVGEEVVVGNLLSQPADGIGRGNGDEDGLSHRHPSLNQLEEGVRQGADFLPPEGRALALEGELS